MKDIIYTPSKTEEGAIVDFTEKFVLDKRAKITVPNQYTAIVFDNEKIAFRVEPCTEKCIYQEYGKELRGHTMQIAFIHTKAIPMAMWGFGNVQINNERLNETYCVGVNGTYSIDVIDYGKLIGSFPIGKMITGDGIKEKVIAIIKSVGIPILSERFTNTGISVFEANSLLGDIQAKLQKSLADEVKIKMLGIKLTALTVAGVHVNEEDMKRLRESVNSRSTKSEDVPSSTVDMQSEFERFGREISSMVQKEIRDSESRTKNELLRSVMKQVDDQLDTFGKSIASEIDEKIQDMMPLQDGADEDSIKNIQVTADFLIEHANSNDDLIAPAAMIYSNVEENLITKFNLCHENKKFVIDYTEYLCLAGQAIINGQYLLKNRKSDGTYQTFLPRVTEAYSDGTPKTVEMLPIIRFMKAGLSAEKAKQASDMWTVLNRIRHNSPENAEALSEFFEAIDIERTDYLQQVLDFFRENGLYTKD